MGLLEKLFPKKNKDAEQAALVANYFKSLTTYQPVWTNWNGELYESELVRSAIDARARHISKLKVEILGSAQPALQTRLKKAPNPWHTWSQFLYRVSTILDMQNTAFIVPVFNKYLETIGYFPVLPSRCTVVEYEKEPWLRYSFNNGGYAAVEMKRCAVLTKFQYLNDFFGTNNDALDSTMSLIDIQNQGIEEAVKSSATYRFMAQMNNFAKAEDLTKERKRFSEENLSSEAGGGGLLLFPNIYTNIQQIKPTPYTVDSGQMEQIRTNVYNYFGVNADILQNKAYGDAWSAFYEGCVEWFAIQFSDAMTRAIFSDTEQAYGAAIMATSNRLQYLSNKDKLEVSAQMADRGIFSRNEIREIWNLPPVEGGDTPTIRGEYYLLGTDGTITRHDDDLTGGVKDAGND